jgi:hypothetical protein
MPHYWCLPTNKIYRAHTMWLKYQTHWVQDSVVGLRVYRCGIVEYWAPLTHDLFLCTLCRGVMSVSLEHPCNRLSATQGPKVANLQGRRHTR